MSTTASPIWLELDRSPHAVQFYSGDGFLLDSLARFVCTALEAAESALVIATEVHRDGLAERLKARGVDTDRSVKDGQYVTVDAFQALEQLTVDGELDKTRFDEFMRRVVLPLKAAAESEPQRVAVCGEIVAILWAAGKAEAAIELEHFWNELARQGCSSNTRCSSALRRSIWTSIICSRLFGTFRSIPFRATLSCHLPFSREIRPRSLMWS